MFFYRDISQKKKKMGLNYTFKKLLILLAGFFMSFNASALISGSKTIPLDYPSIAAFVADLNLQGVGPGGVTLTVPAGYTETAPAGGYIITASGTVSDQIVITGDGALPLPIITASPALTAGALNDAIFVLHGADVVTIQGLQLQENPANTITAAATNNMTEWGIALLYITTTNGAQFNSIVNNTISLDRTYQNTFGIYSNSTHSLTSVTTSVTTTTLAGNNGGLKIHGNSISDVNNGIVVVGPTLAASHNDVIDIGGTIPAEGNTITDYGTTGTFSAYANVSGTVYGILVRNSTNFNISNNSISSSVGGTTSGTLRGIFVPSFSNAPIGTFVNTVNGNTLSIIGGSATGAIDGIAIQGTSATATSSLSVNSNIFNALGHAVPSSGTIIFISQISPAQTVSVSMNSFNSLGTNTSGSVTFIGANYSMPASGSQTYLDNLLIGGFSKTSSGGTVTVFTTNGSSPAGSTHTATGNNFSGITVTGATVLNGWMNTDGGALTKNISNNTFSNWTGGTSAVTVMSQNFGGTGTSVTNNTILNITGQAAVTGITFGGSNSGIQTCSNNSITGLSSTGGGGNVTGINNSASAATSISYSGNTIMNLSTTAVSGTCTGITSATTNTVNIFGNTISGLSASGTSPVISGIITTGAQGTTNVFKNKIYNLDASGVVTNTAVNGIFLPGGLNVNVYNNLIAGLTAPNGNSATAMTGISVTSPVASSTYKVYYNSVYLNASSTGTNFGTTGIFHTASGTSTTASLDFRNNIIINESVANGTGLTVAYRRSGVLFSNYNLNSNRNLFYAGVPSVTNVIFSDGTTSQQTLADFQTLVAPREMNSITGETFTYSLAGSFFISLTGSSSDFLRPVAGITSQVESGAQQITAPLITDDFSAFVRAGNIGYTGTGTNPDLGAYEFEGISPAPVIMLNSVTPGTTTQCSATARLVSVNITTASGSIIGATLYFAFNGTPQTPIVMVNTSGTTWEATLPVASPANATVTWSVVADNSVPLSSSIIGTAYYDEPLSGITAAASSSVSPICPNDLTSLSVIVLSNTAPIAAPAYSAPPAVTNPTTDEDLGNVTISLGASIILNNTSAINSLTGSIGIATGTVGSYSDFTAFGPFDLQIDQTYNFSVSSLQQVTPFNNAIAIYIDYNKNGVFTDPGEQVYTSLALTSGAHTETGSFIVPSAASPGLTRMRIINNETTLISSPTQTVAYGEYEEYMINLIPEITIVTWSDGVGTVGTTNPLDVNPSSTTTYTADFTLFGCIFSPAPTTTVTVNSIPTSPAATNSGQCAAQIPTASVASTTGAVTPTFNWYDAPVAGLLVQSGTSTTYTSIVSSTTTFYVSEVDGVTGCESLLTPVTVTIGPADGISATAAFSTICIGSTADLTASNTNPVPVQNYTYTWSGVAGSGADVPVMGTTVSVLPTVPGTYTYDLSAADGTCNATAQVTVTVDPFDATITAIDITCMGLTDGTFALATSSCGTIPYTYSVDASPFGAIPTNLSAGTYNVIIQDDNGYTTAGQMITIVEPTIVISDPVATDIIICQDDLSAMVSATATTNIPSPATISWWDNSTAGTQLGTGSPFEVVGTSVLPSTSAPGMYTVYAQGQDGVCSSANRTAVNINILPSSFNLIVAAQCDPYTLNSTTYSTTGIYSQTLVNMIGCDSIITLDLTIYDPSSSLTIYTACDSYTWTDGNTYLIGGTYTQTLVNSLGCDSIATLDLTMVTSPIATASDNGDGTITASTGTSYEWIDCLTGLAIPGETNQTLILTANGSYAAVVISGGICDDTSDCVVINYMGIDEVTNSVINLYPNPTHDQVTITMNAPVAMVEVFDAQGKLLNVLTVENNGQVDLSNYERGVYYLRIKTENDSSLHRVVKQ